MKIAGYETHPAADVFPMLGAKELRELAEDIKANGLQHPVILFADGGKRLVLDGRNRLAACEIAGVSPEFAFWAGEGTPTSYVKSLNLHRRHLNESQRAMFALELARIEAGERGEEPKENADEGARANLPAGRERDRIAEEVNVSSRLVADAQVVEREAAPEVIEAVKRGEVAVSKVAKEIRAAREEKAPKKPAAPEPKAKSGQFSLVLTMPESEAARVIRQLELLQFLAVVKGGVTVEMRFAGRRSA